MTTPPYDAFTIAQRLGSALEMARVPYAIGGALALGIWSDPRGTYDVDINLFVDHANLDPALDVLTAAGLQLDRAAALAADLAGDVIIGRYEGMRIDLFTPSIPFSWEAADNVRRIAGVAGALNYLSAESLAVFKLLFFRPKDLVDVERLIVVQGGDIDVAYIRRWLVDMMGEGDERVNALDAILQRHSRT